MKRVLVGMSGGVDSSVTAHLLKKEGYEVEGVSFILWEARSRINLRTCCSFVAINGAKETAELLGIRHRAIDVQDDFMEKVIDPFVNAYLHGITPNPCVICNIQIKFPYLLREAERSDAELIATGHYARVEKRDDTYLLKKGVDSTKDQSYFLYVLDQETLNRLVFPLGFYSKDRVREIAEELKLPSIRRPESVEICFIEEDYSCLIKNLLPEATKSGPIIGPDGSILGTHQGIYNYTMGQRRGLNISYSEPLYVIKIDAEHNAIHVGTRELAFKKVIYVRGLNWTMPRKNFDFLGTSIDRHVSRVTAKIRSMMKGEPSVLSIEDGDKSVRLVFDKPQWAPAPGQSAVFYDDDVVLGGGIIQ